MSKRNINLKLKNMKRKNLLSSIMLITAQLIKTDITLTRSEALKNCWSLYNDLKLKFGIDVAIQRLQVISTNRGKKETNVGKHQNIKISQENACDIIEKHFKTSILNYFKYKGFSLDDSKDMLQEVHIKIYMNFDKFNPLNSKSDNELNAFKSFVFKTCENYIGNMRDKNSKQNRQKELTVSIDTNFNNDSDGYNQYFEVPSDENINLSIENNEITHAINNAIQNIKNETIRKIIPLWMQDYSEKDIMDELSVSVETVKNSVNRGKKILSKTIVLN